MTDKELQEGNFNEDELRAYLTNGINPYAVRANANNNEQAAASQGLPEGQVMTPEDFDAKLAEKKPALFAPTSAENDAADNMHETILEQRAQEKYPDEASIQAKLRELDQNEEAPSEQSTPDEMPKAMFPGAENVITMAMPEDEQTGVTSDKAAEEAKTAIKNISTPFDTAQSEVPNAQLIAKDSQKDQENKALEAEYAKLKTTDPIEYVRKKYGFNPKQDLVAERDMRDDLSYDKLKKMQRQSGILDAIGDVDTSIGQLGDWNTMESRKAGYTGEYKGGVFNKLAAKKEKDFKDRMDYQEADLKRQGTGLEQEKKGQEFLKAQKEFEILSRDDKEMNDPNSDMMQMLKDIGAKYYGIKDLPPGVTPKKFLAVLPQAKDFVTSEMAARNALELQRQKHKDALELEAAKARTKGSKLTASQQGLENAQVKDLAEKKGTSEVLSLIDSLTGTKEILKNSDVVSGGMIGLLPDWARKSLLDKSPRVETDINSVLALPNLKAIFGGNPTEGERKVLLDTLFDPKQDEKEILRRVEALEKRMLAAAKENDRQKQWIKTHGNLQDYVPGEPEGLSTMTKNLAKELGIELKSEKPAPGSIITLKTGKKMRVAADGETLEEIK